MADNRPDIAALLQAWRECGIQRPGSLRAHRIEALAARAAPLQGSARDVLDAKLQLLIQTELAAHADTDSSAVTPASGDASPLRQSPADPAGLSALVLRLSGVRGGTSPHTGAADQAASESEAIATMAGDADASAPTPDEAAFPALPALDAIRQTWARLRTASHLQHIMADVPEDAGPLHSTVLVHRAIALMHDTAPAYLQYFLGYVDALAGVERLSPTPATTPAPRSPRPLRPASPANASRPRKAPRRRSRGRPRPA